MTDDQTTPDATNPAETPEAVTPETPPEEWKPEPRQWTWKDLFMAPMLAFKPKCMVISALTLIALGLFLWAWGKLVNVSADLIIIAPIVSWGTWVIGAAIFTLGASLVSIFMKADLLDDEFLSLKEALGQMKSRLVAALLVPSFLVLVVAGFYLMIYGAELVGSIPYIGSLLYALLYLLGFLLALFTVLLTIGALLGIFVGPAVIAIRRHSWFDNVIDTFEAVGTKPHVLILNLGLTVIMMTVCYTIGQKSMGELERMATTSSHIPGAVLARTEARASGLATRWFSDVDPWLNGSLHVGLHSVPLAGGLAGGYFLPERHPLEVSRQRSLGRLIDYFNAKIEQKRQRAEAIFEAIDGNGDTVETQMQLIDKLEKQAEALYASIADAHRDLRHDTSDDDGTAEERRYQARHLSGWDRWFSGLVVGLWKGLITLLLLGYAINLFLAGGMLTYLGVREDDYWDDEDLEDLDQLAKELEEEAKQEQAAAEDQATTPPPAPESADASTDESSAQETDDVDSTEKEDSTEAQDGADSEESKSAAPPAANTSATDEAPAAADDSASEAAPTESPSAVDEPPAHDDPQELSKTDDDADDKPKKKRKSKKTKSDDDEAAKDD